MSFTRKTKSFVLLFFLVANLLLFAEPSKNEQQPSAAFRSDARLVVVDVVLNDASGRPIQGLKKEDFVISEDGKPQSIVAFEEHGQATAPKVAQAPNLLKNEYTNYAVRNDSDALTVLLLDTLNSSRQDLAYARSEMITFLRKLPPGRRVALYTLSSQLRMVQGFTDDSDTLIAAAQQLSTRPHSIYSNNREMSATIGEIAESGLLKKSPKAFAALQRFLGDDYEGKLEVRSQDTLDTLTQVARALAAVPGRKNLIWISGGFPFDSLTNADRLQRVSALLAATRIAVYPVDVRGLLSMQADGATRDSELFAPVQTRSYETIAGLDEENRTLVETMQNVAEITGGRAYTGRNDLDRAIGEAIESGSHYYSLAYRPSNNNWNGSFRKITVKTDKSKAKALYRNGYFAVVDPLSTKEDPNWVAGFAMQREAPVSTQLIMKARVVPPDELGQPVGIDMLIDAHDLVYATTEDKQHRPEIQFIAVAWDNNGKKCGSFSETFNPTLSREQLQKLLRNGMQFHQPMALAPGTYQLRLGVMDRLARRVGTLDVPLVIEAKQAAK